MNRWLVAYKDSQGKWRAFSYVGNRSRIPEKIEKLFKYFPNVEQIQIQKVE